MFRFPVLVGDIGGTNARFAIVPEPGQAFIPLPRMLTASSPEPVDAIRTALTAYAGPAPRSAMIAVANRVDGLAVRLTNADWTIDARAIGMALDLDRVTLVNDYPPVAVSPVALEEARGDLARIGPAPFGDGGIRLVLGPGTGFGAAALAPVGEYLAILATEAGHMELGPATADEFPLWPHIERVGGRVTVETILSGPGLLRLAAASAASRGEPLTFGAPNDVLARAQEGHPLAREAVGLFVRLLGRVTGDLALAFEATGGVFIAGGIAPKMLQVLREGEFRAAFEAKSPHEEWAARIPVAVIAHSEPALLGLSELVSQPGRFVFSSKSWDRNGG